VVALAATGTPSASAALRPVGHSVSMAAAPVRADTLAFDDRGRLCCAMGPSDPRQLTDTDVAFDGTVVAIRPDVSKRRGFWRTDAVTFTVHEWFRGGGGDTVTISFPQAERIDEPATGAAPYRARRMNYTTGTRILVHGSLPPGSTDPETMSAGVQPCGATDYHDRRTATHWRDLTARRR
jgi:hypothetical protein